MIERATKNFVFIICLTLLVSLGCITQSKTGSSDSINNQQGFVEGFDAGKLNLKSWQITQQGDFNESVVDVYDVNQGEGTDYRLRLRANTLGTRDDVVKYLGLKSIQPIEFTSKKEISFDLDWNKQANGSYMSAGVYICPTSTVTNPKDEKDWLKFEYVGVPPGHNARSVIAIKNNGLVKFHYMDGWPGDRKGRTISLQRITIVLDEKSLQVFENNKETFYIPSHGLGFTKGYLYLKLRSHSNYPAREVFFDNITIGSAIGD